MNWHIDYAMVIVVSSLMISAHYVIIRILFYLIDKLKDKKNEG